MINIIMYSKTNNLNYIEQQMFWIKQIDSRFIFETILHIMYNITYNVT